MKRPSLYLLPIAFLVIPIGGFPLLENTFLKLLGQDDFARFFSSSFIIVILDSLIMFFWMLALASNQPVYRPWKAVLALYLTIILPGAIAFPGATLIVLKLGDDSSPIYTPITWMLIAYILLWGSYKLLRSRLFTPFIGDRFGAWHVRLQLVAGLTVFLLYALMLFKAVAV